MQVLNSFGSAAATQLDCIKQQLTVYEQQREQLQQVFLQCEAMLTRLDTVSRLQRVSSSTVSDQLWSVHTAVQRHNNSSCTSNGPPDTSARHSARAVFSHDHALLPLLHMKLADQLSVAYKIMTATL